MLSMDTSHRRTLALGAAIALGLAAVIDFVVWATAHEKDFLYVAAVFAVAALLWAGVSFKWRTRGDENL
jgi:hypothetical protein